MSENRFTGRGNVESYTLRSGSEFWAQRAQAEERAQVEKAAQLLAGFVSAGQESEAASVFIEKEKLGAGRGIRALQERGLKLDDDAKKALQALVPQPQLSLTSYQAARLGDE